MTYRQYNDLRTSAMDCTALDDYIAECGGNVPAEFLPEDGDATIAVQVLTDIWTIAHDPHFTTLQKIAGLGNRAFAAQYGVSCRTVESWRAGKRNITQSYFDLLCADVITEKNRIL